MLKNLSVPEKLPVEWIQALFTKLKAIWGEKWTKNISDDVLAIAIEEWRESLAGLTGEDIKYALNIARNQLEWPPSIAEFRNLAKARKGSYEDVTDVVKRLIPPKEYVPPSPLLQEFMARQGNTSVENMLSAEKWLANIRVNLTRKSEDRRVGSYEGTGLLEIVKL